MSVAVAIRPRRARGPRAAGLLAATLLAAGLAPPARATDGVHAGFQDIVRVVAPGDTFTLELRVLESSEPFNAFDASIRFDPARLAFVPTNPVAGQRGPLMTSACSNTFHVFTPTPDSLRITLSLLCGGVTVAGPGEIYRVRFRALESPGPTTVSLGPFTRFFNAGFSVDPLVRRSIQVQVGSPTAVETDGAAVALAGPSPNPSSGRSSLALRLTTPQRARLAVLDLQGRARLERVWALGAGDHHLEWDDANLAPGLYVVRLSLGDRVVAARRWIVMR